MPTISMFYGIIVKLSSEDNENYRFPHIHVHYENQTACIAVEDGRILSGDFPRKQLLLVQAWIEIHQDELVANWEITVEGEQPFSVSPLK